MASTMGEQQEQLVPKTKWQHFESGVLTVMKQWTALQLAVEGGWGGGNSQRKYEILLEEILYLFKKHPNVFLDDLAINIEDYVEEEFNLICEDGSIDEIAALLVNMAKECQAGDFTRVEKLLNPSKTTCNSQNEMLSKENAVTAAATTTTTNSALMTNTNQS